MEVFDMESGSMDEYSPNELEELLAGSVRSARILKV